MSISITFSLQMVRLVLSVFTHMKDHAANKEWKRSYFTQIKELYDMDKDMVVSMLTENAVYWIHPNLECSEDKIHALKLLYYKIFGIGVSNVEMFQSYFYFKEDEWRTYAETGEKTEEHYKLFVDTHNKLYKFLREAKDKLIKYFGNDTMFGPPNRDYLDIEEESITWIWEGDSDSDSDGGCSCDECNDWETTDEED